VKQKNSTRRLNEELVEGTKASRTPEVTRVINLVTCANTNNKEENEWLEEMYLHIIYDNSVLITFSICAFV
jgi:hypothetical protein